MIYVPTTSDPVYVRIPRTLADTPADAPVLTLTGTADRRVYSVPVTDFSADGLYYAFEGDFSAVKTPGEYEYRLTAGGANLATGIMRIGDTPNPAPDTYEISHQYEQYVAD